MTVVNYRNDRGDYELPGHDPVPGYSRVAAMKAKQGLEIFKLKRAVETCQWAALNGEENWLYADSYHLVRSIDDADTRKADAGTCVARAIELMTTDGLAPAEAAKEACIEQDTRIAAWTTWAETSVYQRRKEKLRKPPRINFTPDLDYVIACCEGFVRTIRDIGFTIVAAEQTVFTPGLFAGTADLFGRFGDQPLQCWDVKTGARIYPDMNLQLGGYSNAELWVTSDGINIELNPAPDIDKLNGGIFHVTEHGTDAYPMNLEGAWEAFTGLIAVRRHDTLCKDTPLTVLRADGPHSPVGPATEPDDLRTDWIVNHTRRISTNANVLADLKRRWPNNTPFKPPWTDTQLAELTAIVSQVAHTHNLDDPQHPFGPPDPTPPRPERTPTGRRPVTDPYPTQPHNVGHPADPAAIDALTNLNNDMHPDETALVTRWVTDARIAHRPFGLGDPTTADIRRFEIARAAISLATRVAVYNHNTVDDTDCRTIIANVTGWDITAEQTTGGLLGSLTEQQALQVEEIAHNFPSTGKLEAK